MSVTDEQRCGRPSTSADLVPAIKDTVRSNRRVLLKELEEQFNLSQGSIWDIVHERLGYRKVCTRWVPRQLTEDHKKKTVWVHPSLIPSALMIMVRISWANHYWGWNLAAPVLSWDKSTIHSMETSRVSHRQKIQDINKHWEADGNCVLGHAWCASVALFSS